MELIGREEEIRVFERTLAALPGSPRPLVLSVFGEPGVGKSELLARFGEIATEAGAASALVDHRQEDVPAAMARILEELPDRPREARSFFKRHEAFREKHAALASDPEAPSGWNLVGRIVGGLGVGIGKEVPGLRTALGFVDTKEAVARMGEVGDFISRRVRGKDDRYLLANPIAALTPLFLEALRRLAQSRPLALLFDSFEVTGEFLEEWLFALVDQGYGEPPPNLLLVAAGEAELNYGRWARHAEAVVRLRMEPLTPEEARAHLRGCGVPEDSIDRIVEMSRLPLALNLACGSAAAGRTHADPAEGIVKWFLSGVEDSQSELVTDAALPRILNRDVVEVLVGKERADDDLRWLRTRPFVRVESTGWTYQRQIRTELLREKRRETPRGWGEVHGRLAGFYEACKVELGLDETKGRTNPQWRGYQIEALFHRICQAPHLHRSHALNGFFTAFGAGRPLEAAWAEAVRQAGSDLQDRDLETLGDRLLDVVRALQAEERERAIDLLTNLLGDPTLEGVGRAAALDWRGWLQSIAGRPAAALRDLTEAVRLAPGEAEFHADRGRLFATIERPDEAVADLTRAIELGADRPSVFTARAAALEIAGRHAEAWDDLDRAVQRAPDQVGVLMMRGNAALLLGRLDDAVEDAETAARLDPENLPALWLRFEALRRKGDAVALGRALGVIAERSAAVVEATVEEFSKVPESGFQRRLVEERLTLMTAGSGMDPSAVIRLVDLARQDPEAARRVIRAELEAARALVSLQAGALDQVVEASTTAIELDPENAGYFALRARARTLQGMPAEALPDLDRALQLAPDNWQLRGVRGQLRAARGNLKDALADYDEVVRLAPTDSRPLVARAALLFQMEEGDRALSDLDRAADLEPSNVTIESVRLAMLHARGDMEAVAEAMTRIADRAEDFIEQIQEQTAGVSPEVLRSRIAKWPGSTAGQADEFFGLLAVAGKDPAAAVRMVKADAARARAFVHLQKGDLDQAVAQASEAIAHHPEEGKSRLLRALTLMELGRHGEAVTDLDAVIDRDPNNAEALARRGACHRKLGEAEKALADLDRALDLDPSLTGALKDRAMLHRAEGRDQEALDDMGRAIAVGGEDAPALRRLRGLILGELGRHAEAVPDFDAAIGHDPGDAEAFAFRGASYRQLGEAGKALADLTRALDLDPGSTWAVVERVLVLIEEERHGDALADLDRALPQDRPADPALLFHRADLLRRMGRSDDALSDIDRALRAGPGIDLHGRLLACRAELRRRVGAEDAARADLNQALELTPSLDWGLALRGEIELAGGDAESALKDLTRAIEIAPDDDWYRYWRAAALRALGHGDRAAEDLRTAIRLAEEASTRSPRSRAFQFNRALYLLAGGQPEAAERAYREALAAGGHWVSLGAALDDVAEMGRLGPRPPEAAAIEHLLRDSLSRERAE